jgi:hypothetical protein
MLQALLCLLPAIVLVIPLLARRYPGERALVALRRTRHERWQRPRSSVLVRSRVVVLASVRGGRLIGRSLAVRPPPTLLAAS